MQVRKLFFICFFLCFSASLSFGNDSITLKKRGLYSCGKQPKQVIFSPDSKYIIFPLLDDSGFDIFSVSENKFIKRVTCPSPKSKGFAEGLFIPQKSVFLISQMTTASLHEFSYPDFEYKRTIPTGGVWSKFIAYSPEKNILAVSNWLSNDISIIDYDSGNLIRTIPTKAAPRGLYFIDGGDKIISLAFDGGEIELFEVANGERLEHIAVKKSCMRHIVVDASETFAYVSDMYNRKIYKINLSLFQIVDQIQVFNNPNTIDLLDNYLFVSCRGPNSRNVYTDRSPVNGRIFLIDCATFEIMSDFEGGNQPTGLDVSPDGSLLCFSNFQDANMELYEIIHDEIIHEAGL